MGKKLFLSYAEEDSAIANKIADRLKAREFAVYNWQDADQRGKQFISEMEKQIAGTDIFLVLLSPDYLVSPWCKHEWNYALRRVESQTTVLFLVASVRSVDYLSAGFLGNYDCLDLTGSGFEGGVNELLKKLQGAPTATVSTSADKPESMEWPLFQNRAKERDAITDSLLIPGGDQFFLVLSGPQMGKTWLLQQVFVDLAEKDREKKWQVTRLDLRDFGSDYVKDTQFILARLFNVQSNRGNDEEFLAEIVRTISRSKRSWLCMLDSAELLSSTVAAQLRVMLSRIHAEVISKIPDAGFAFIAASRVPHSAWRGIMPAPRFRTITLTHFSLDIIKNALFEMTQVDERTGFKEAWYEKTAHSLHRATEGLPALLIKYMQWIRDKEYYFAAEDIEGNNLFGKLAVPYIELLLRMENLVLSDRDRERVKNDPAILETVLQELVVYRILSVSCLEKILDDNPDIGSRVSKLKWKRENLWDKILDTPLIEPSQDIWAKTYTAIRRLLFRYWYDTSTKQAQVHFEAGRFYDGWWHEVTGTDKAMVLVERLWHEIEYERLNRGKASQAPVTQFAKKLFRDGIRSNHHTHRELSSVIEQRLGNDPELANSLEEINPRAFEKLIAIVQSIKDQ